MTESTFKCDVHTDVTMNRQSWIRITESTFKCDLDTDVTIHRQSWFCYNSSWG